MRRASEADLGCKGYQGSAEGRGWKRVDSTGWASSFLAAGLGSEETTPKPHTHDASEGTSLCLHTENWMLSLNLSTCTVCHNPSCTSSFQNREASLSLCSRGTVFDKKIYACVTQISFDYIIKTRGKSQRATWLGKGVWKKRKQCKNKETRKILSSLGKFILHKAGHLEPVTEEEMWDHIDCFWKKRGMRGMEKKHGQIKSQPQILSQMSFPLLIMTSILIFLYLG